MENKNPAFINQPDESAFELSDEKLDGVTGGVLGRRDESGQFLSPKWGFCWQFEYRDPNPLNQSGTGFCYRCKYWDLEHSIKTGDDLAPCNNPKNA